MVTIVKFARLSRVIIGDDARIYNEERKKGERRRRRRSDAVIGRLLNLHLNEYALSRETLVTYNDLLSALTN